MGGGGEKEGGGEVEGKRDTQRLFSPPLLRPLYQSLSLNLRLVQRNEVPPLEESAVPAECIQSQCV